MTGSAINNATVLARFGSCILTNKKVLRILNFNRMFLRLLHLQTQGKEQQQQQQQQQQQPRPKGRRRGRRILRKKISWTGQILNDKSEL
jgi:hypothetical protein